MNHTKFPHAACFHLLAFFLVGISAAPSLRAETVQLPLPVKIKANARANFKISADNQFKNLIKEESLQNGKSVPVSLDKEGSYYWRLTEGRWSLAEGNLVYLAPSGGAKQWYRLRWEPNPKASGYRIQFFKSDKRIATVETKGTVVLVPATETGTLTVYERVAGNNVLNKALVVSLERIELAPTVAIRKIEPTSAPPAEEDEYAFEYDPEDDVSMGGEISETSQPKKDDEAPKFDPEKAVQVRRSGKHVFLGGKIFKESFRVERDLNYEAEPTLGLGATASAKAWTRYGLLDLWIDTHGTQTEYDNAAESDAPAAKQKRVFLQMSWGYDVLSIKTKNVNQALVVAPVIATGMVPLTKDEETVLMYGLGMEYFYWLEDDRWLFANLEMFMPGSLLFRGGYDFTVADNFFFELGVYQKSFSFKKDEVKSTFKESGILGSLGRRI
ncbi:MAG: hypothetical protein AB7T49_15135 [Oligoflexales bacterium]